jgi:hypothetical protein
MPGARDRSDGSGSRLDLENRPPRQHRPTRRMNAAEQRELLELPISGQRQPTAPARSSPGPFSAATDRQEGPSRRCRSRPRRRRLSTGKTAGRSVRGGVGVWTGGHASGSGLPGPASPHAEGSPAGALLFQHRGCTGRGMTWSRSPGSRGPDLARDARREDARPEPAARLWPGRRAGAAALRATAIAVRELRS